MHVALHLNSFHISSSVIYIYIYIHITLTPDSIPHFSSETWVQQSAPLLAQGNQSTTDRYPDNKTSQVLREGCPKNKAANEGAEMCDVLFIFMVIIL